MKTVLLAAAAALLTASAAGAAALRLELQPKEGKIIRALNGLQAVDSRTDATLVRVISPGLNVKLNRGTLRVLVMNLGTRPFTFGPKNVAMRLADGTPVRFMALREFRDGIQLVQRETAREAGVRSRINSNLDGINTTGASVPNGQSMSANNAASQASTTATGELDLPSDDVHAAAERLQGAVDSLLPTDTLGPQQATGGYLMFELPKSMRGAKTDQPLELIVSAGGEEHRFSAVLRRH